MLSSICVHDNMMQPSLVLHMHLLGLLATQTKPCKVVRSRRQIYY